MVKKTVIACTLVLSTLSGCTTTMPPGTSLGRAVLTDVSVNRRAWLSKVEIVDPSVSYMRDLIESSLTLSVQEYLREGRYFAEINLLPGKVERDDLVLQLQFSRYQQTRSPHPAYFPVAILTATLYIWFGGPIFVDTSDLSGTLTVKDASNPPDIQASSQVHEEHSVSFWSPEYVFPSGMETRTSAIAELFKKVFRDMNSSRGGPKA